MVKTTPIYGDSGDSLLLLFYPHLSYFFPPTLVQILSQDNWLQRWVLPPSCLPFSELLVHLYIGCFESHFSLVKVWLLLGCWVEIAKKTWIEARSHFSVLFPKFFSSKNVGLPAGFPHQELLKVKLVRAAQKALEVARKNNGGYNKAQALAAAAFVEVSELKTKWSLVQTFQQKQEMGRWDEGGHRPPGMAWWNFGCCNMWSIYSWYFMILCAYLCIFIWLIVETISNRSWCYIGSWMLEDSWCTVQYVILYLFMFCWISLRWYFSQHASRCVILVFIETYNFGPGRVICAACWWCC